MTAKTPMILLPRLPCDEALQAHQADTLAVGAVMRYWLADQD